MKTSLFHKVFAVVALALAVLISGSVITSAAGASKTTKKSLVKSIDAVMAQKNSPPGISVLVTGNGRTQYFSRGEANVKTGTAPKRSEHARIASIAKAFSGAVALNLVRQGKLRVNSTIGEILPGKLPKAKNVTLGQVLNHTAGLPDYIKQPAFLKKFGGNLKTYFAPRKLISYVKNVKLTHRPGKKYEYSDTDNIVAGLMAEKVTGVSYERLLRRLVYRRLNLTGTSLPRTPRMPRPFIHGYDVDPIEDYSEALNPSGAWASGGVVSTVDDLSKFFRGYVGGRKLIGPKLKRIQRHFRPGESQPPGPGRNDAGMALFRYTSKCGVVFGHTGSFPGYRAFAASSANGKRSVVYLVNLQVTPTSNFKNHRRVSALIRRSQTEAVCHAFR